MQNKRLFVVIVALSATIICFGLGVMIKPRTTAQPAESLQSILMEHIEYSPEVYRAHENYAGQLYNDTIMLIYRYSSRMCTPCYQDDLIDLKEFIEIICRNVVLVLPAYPSNDRRSHIRINSETQGLKYRNIPPDSLALPIHADEGEKRYFAIMDTQGHVGMVFFPEKGRQDLTRRYFREIAKFFPSHTDVKKDSVVITP
ncbi:MAG: hypothetical protein LBQ60_20560 [Bacteroidales bacterium]|jgi:hypothetical protein|nr:hypothetical protein [Bacteroidales bacterium]